MVFARKGHVRVVRGRSVMVRPHSVIARRFISHKIGVNVGEGRSVRQAVAVAYGQARRRGFRV